MPRWPATLSLLLLLTTPLAAQSEADLKRYFEGKRVTLTIDMPGTEQGVDVYPADDRPLDYPRYASGSRITAPPSRPPTTP